MFVEFNVTSQDDPSVLNVFAPLHGIQIDMVIPTFNAENNYLKSTFSVQIQNHLESSPLDTRAANLTPLKKILELNNHGDIH
jgi:hypothetical protein